MIDVPEVFRGYAVVRAAAVVYVVVVNAVRLPEADHPAVLGVVMAVVVLWSALAVWCYATPSRRRPWVFAADLAGTLLLVAVGPWVLGAQHAELSVVPLWNAAAAMALALWSGWVTGAGAAVVISVTDVLVRGGLGASEWGGKLGFVLLTAAVGYLVTALRRYIQQRDTVTATAAAMQERARLARVVHDGVLQVLALVERDAPGLGPRGVRLAGAARQQEIQLRRFLQQADLDATDVIDVTVADLAAVLDRHSSTTVTVSTPADRVVVPAEVASELDQAVSEVLANVTRHAGPAALAWVLLERGGGEVVVSVRDNGVGCASEALEQAHQRGRLGVHHSICGRLRDLGGQARPTAVPGRGVEWELRVPEGAG